MKIFFKALAGLLISGSFMINTANAGLIEFREFEGNNSGLIYVEDLNMEFLHLSYTANMTHADAISNFSSDGFTDTSVNLANQLFGAIGISPHTDLTNPVWLDAGITLTYNGDRSDLWNTPWFTWFGDLNTGTGRDAWIILSQEGTSLTGIDNPMYFIDQDGTSDSDIALGTRNTSLTNMFTATLLGRAINEVPEPSTLAIFALGMIGLASRRFKKQS